MDKFSFVHYSVDENGVASGHSKVFSAEYLPNILDAFRSFLIEAGFTYVDEIVAVSGDIEYSSSDLDSLRTSHRRDYASRYA